MSKPRRTSKRTYISTVDIRELLTTCKPTEIELYTHLMELPSGVLEASEMTSERLSEITGISIGNIKNSRAALVKKELLFISRFKDEFGLNTVRVILGKRKVRNYLLKAKAK